MIMTIDVFPSIKGNNCISPEERENDPNERNFETHFSRLGFVLFNADFGSRVHVVHHARQE